ncbi:MarR family transcriptional regulator [Denitrobaculum tricleocarpae]|uniref:MarR family transcriptional regulator n=1 Tax=Denitrobaculum tricleocarpae TaxID=2591009 RepID=A0A545TGN3_9PROT|nr:MarR family transcriptional regulator [Denitrobaculum tricleocarpae]
MEQIEDCISFLIGKAGQQVTRRARELLAPHGVTPVQYAVLKILAEDDGISGSDLGSRMKLDSASITGVVDRMESLGLVERLSDAEDRRVQRIYATGKGCSLQGPLDAAMDRLNAEAAAVLGGEAAGLPRHLRLLGERKNWMHLI